ncbi:SKP1-like protein 21 [Carex littledalei]|uniref:SKP1-like protein 21 n=1 Tax=Carex littledalei TaxID=544730 RepID=A0A833QLM8_9POAL|nr:SKP1-like protein 21 [Carex littledalei]
MLSTLGRGSVTANVGVDTGEELTAGGSSTVTSTVWSVVWMGKSSGEASLLVATGISTGFGVVKLGDSHSVHVVPGKMRLEVVFEQSLWLICEIFHLPDDLIEEEKLEPLKNVNDDPRIRLLNILYARKKEKS